MTTHSYALIDCADTANQKGVRVMGGATISNYTVVRCPAGGIVAYEDCTIKNTIVQSTGDDLTIAATKTVTGSSNKFTDAARAGTGTYTDAGDPWNWTPDFVSATDFHRTTHGDGEVVTGIHNVSTCTDYAGNTCYKGGGATLGN